MPLLLSASIPSQSAICFFLQQNVTYLIPVCALSQSAPGALATFPGQQQCSEPKDEAIPKCTLLLVFPVRLQGSVASASSPSGSDPLAFDLFHGFETPSPRYLLLPVQRPLPEAQRVSNRTLVVHIPTVGCRQPACLPLPVPWHLVLCHPACSQAGLTGLNCKASQPGRLSPPQFLHV
eukprot:GGOE01012422.1.p2 GENE.GGOE01012422.1~~GGOE01012422.1.p2  ORF type:complete len:178 (-),score=7.24 GGOE01012422.1:2078-2611(-)